MLNSSVPKNEFDINTLVNHYGDNLLRLCFLYLHDYHSAEDAVQETFIKAYRNIDKFRGEADIKTWLTSIAVNECKSQLRKKKYKNLFAITEMDKNTPYYDKVFDDTVINAVCSLKPKYKEVILLFYYQEMKAKDIANILNITESAVTVRLTRAREQLKKSLKGWYFDE